MFHTQGNTNIGFEIGIEIEGGAGTGPDRETRIDIQNLTGITIASISTLSGCGSPEQLERLPELPASEERRLRRAAQQLQQRLVLRQWLITHRLHHAYSRRRIRGCDEARAVTKHPCADPARPSARGGCSLLGLIKFTSGLATPTPFCCSENQHSIREADNEISARPR
ncbi:hypothetical protein EVAR_80974_1 [Eumeta japonica]|uniref:Uncharacterized protein n=1 Tax=Eumeta variegata TaxID=151549 RepID=A0A4C1WR43_EUMVA|nr:hypothetical protein EVAR_80974_1 [Eumeta japonica]